MKDKEFLQWIHDRLVHVHGEGVYVDYMHKLRAIIAVTDPEQLTPNTCSTCRSDIMENITDDFTVTPDGNMTYHGDKPVNVSLIYNPGDSLVRAHTGEESEPCGANESLVNLNPKVLEPVDELIVENCTFTVSDGITDPELDEPVEDKAEWESGDDCMVPHPLSGGVKASIVCVWGDKAWVKCESGTIDRIVPLSHVCPIKSDKEIQVEMISPIIDAAMKEMIAMQPDDLAGFMYDHGCQMQESDDE